MSTEDSIGPTVRMLAAILEHVERAFAEAGCPLTEEQATFVQEARSDLGARDVSA